MKKGFGRTTLILWLLTAGIVSAASAANWDTDGLNGGYALAERLLRHLARCCLSRLNKRSIWAVPLPGGWNGRGA